MADPITPGQVFGRGVVLSLDGSRDKWGKRRIRLLCHPHEGGCGKTYETYPYFLRTGQTRSCGCLHSEQRAVFMTALSRSHGLARHPLYSTWQGIIARCEDPGSRAYRWYGGRPDTQPVTVCPEWRDLARFIADIETEIGPRPPGRHGKMPQWTLNRIDNDGPYAPGNVEWADWFSQARNRRQRARRANAPALTAEAVRLRAEGLPPGTIGRRLGIHRSTVLRYLRDADVSGK